MDTRGRKRDYRLMTEYLETDADSIGEVSKINNSHFFGYLLARSRRLHIKSIYSIFLDRNNENIVESPDIGQPPVKKQKLSMRIFDGIFYSIEKTEGDSVTARCMVCNSVRKGNTKSSGNFIRHYKTSHPAMVTKLSMHLKKSVVDDTSKLLLQPSLEETISTISEFDVSEQPFFLKMLWNKYQLFYIRILF